MSWGKVSSPAGQREFFLKYFRDDSPIGIEFAKAFGILFDTITRRLRSEENMLYKELEIPGP